MAKKAAAKKTAPKKAVKKANVKTQKTSASVADFIAAVDDEEKRADAKAIDKMLREVTGEKPAMWGAAIIGYGKATYTNTMGQADWPKIGFSPRKATMTIYISPALLASDPLMKKIGKHTIGKSCLYFKKLADLDQKVLRELVTKSWKNARDSYG